MDAATLYMIVTLVEHEAMRPQASAPPENAYRCPRMSTCKSAVGV